MEYHIFVYKEKIKQAFEAWKKFVRNYRESQNPTQTNQHLEGQGSGSLVTSATYTFCFG